MDTQTLSGINLKSARYFFNSVESSALASKYVKQRVQEKERKLFKIGFSHHHRYLSFLDSESIRFEDAHEAGLLVKSKDKYFPVFSDRMMFPIINAGIITGFTGRTIVNADPKYFSVRQSPFFRKEELLYGLWQNRKNILKKKFCFLSEGYVDTVTMTSYGLNNTLSLCGTSLNTITAKIIKRYTDRVVIILDGDNPGVLASEKVQNTLKAEKIRVLKVSLKNGLDPDEYLKKFGKKSFLKMCFQKKKENK